MENTNMSAALEVVLSLIDQYSDGIEAAAGTTDNLEASVNSASTAIDSISWSTLEDVSDAATDAGTSLDTASEAATNMESNLASIDPTPLNETAAAANEAGSSIASAGAELSDFDKAASTVAGVGLAATLYGIADAAGSYSDSWSRLGFVMSDTSMSMETAQANYGSFVSGIANSTGRTAGTVRESMIQMSIAGVESVDTMSSALYGLSGASFITGNDLMGMVNSFDQVVRTGRVGRGTLAQLGLTTDDLGMSTQELSAKFAEMTPEARAAFLSAAINAKYGEEAVNSFKMSWEYLLIQLQRAWEWLSIIAGQLILPILIPAIGLLTDGLMWLANTISGLDPFTKGFLGGLILIAGAIAVFAAVMIPLVAMFNGLVAGIELVNIALMFMAANPIVLVIIAIVALVAILVYLYNTNEDFRNSVNNAWNTISGFFGWLAGAADAAFVPIRAALKAVICAIVGCSPGLIPAVQQVPGAFIGAFTAALVFVATLPVRLWGLFLLMLAKLIALQTLAWAYATQAGQNIVNGVIGFVTGLPGQVWGVLVAVGNQIMAIGSYWYNQAYNAAVNIWNGFKAALGIASPSYLERAMMNIGDESSRMVDKLESDANQISSINYGDPFSTMGTPDTSGVTAAGAAAQNVPMKVNVQPMAMDSNAAVDEMTVGVTSSYQTMATSMATTLTGMVETNKLGYNQILNTTKTTLDNLKTQTNTNINAVKTSWNGMRDSLISSAQYMQSGVSGQVNVLSGHIGVFYYDIRNPWNFISGPGPQGFAGNQGRISVPRLSGGFAGSKDELFKLDHAQRLAALCSPDGACFAGVGWDINDQGYPYTMSNVNSYNPNFDAFNILKTVGQFTNTTNPSYGNFSDFTNLAGRWIDDTHYSFYFNSAYGSPAAALQSGAFNCYDGALIMLALASAFGFGGYMAHGLWDGVPHVWAVINGMVMDTTARQGGYGWSSPKVSGPRPSMTNIGTTEEKQINLTIDFKNIPAGMDEKLLATFIAEGMKKDSTIRDAMAEANYKNEQSIKRANGM